MSQYLDKTGLQYFWQNIVSKFVAKESGKGLSTNDFTTALKNKLDGIAVGANNYTLPTASSSTLGGVKVGSGLSISNGVLSASSGGLSIIAEGSVILHYGESSTSAILTRAAKFVISNGLIVIQGSAASSGGFVSFVVELSSDGKTIEFSRSYTDGSETVKYIALG